jgi:hypothetical protein
MVASSALRSVAVRKLEETHNGTVGYWKCLNALPGSVVGRVSVCLLVVSSWSVRSNRLPVRT